VIAFLTRLLAAAPDAISAAIFLVAWVAPQTLGAAWVKNLMLTMLIEFIVIHSSGFYAGLLATDDLKRRTRLAMLCGLSAFYLIFIVAFCLAFDSTWPLAAFAWLFLGRFAHILTHPVADADAVSRLLALWAASVVSYIAGALFTVMVPLPALGITPEFVAAMSLSGSGEWIERPYTVLAFGAFYFAVQAWVKYAATDSATTQRAALVAAAPRKPPA
jgi:hypothetical protein